MRGNGRSFQRRSMRWIAFCDTDGRTASRLVPRESKEAVRVLRHLLEEAVTGLVHTPWRTTRVVIVGELFDPLVRLCQLNSRRSPTHRSPLW